MRAVIDVHVISALRGHLPYLSGVCPLAAFVISVPTLISVGLRAKFPSVIGSGDTLSRPAWTCYAITMHPKTLIHA